MNPLLGLPCEIRHIVFSHLPQSTLAQLCLVNHQSYTLCLPHLYRHVRISIRRQTMQLGKGLQRSSLLRHVVENHTRHLTLVTSQSSFQWLISNAQADWCRRWMPNLLTLTFCDFTILPVERLAYFLVSLVSVKSLSLRYCNLVCLHQPQAFIPMVSHDHYLLGIYQLPASYYYSHHSKNNVDTSTTTSTSRSSVSCLLLDWTDFSPTAIDLLLNNLPQLSRVFFGANHNRISNANTMALKALEQHCPHVNTLKIALQQACPIMVRRLITHYGPQLLQLDIQCQDTETLKIVAKHAKMVEWLAIHAIGIVQRQQEHMDEWAFDGMKENDDGDDDDDDDRHNSNSNFARNRTTAATIRRNHRKQIELDGIEGIVQQCHQLVRMDMISWGFCAIPSVILLVLAHRQKHQRHQRHQHHHQQHRYNHYGQQQLQKQQQSHYPLTKKRHSGDMLTVASMMGLNWSKSTAAIHLDSPILLSPASSWSEKTSLALDRKTLADIRNLID